MSDLEMLNALCASVPWIKRFKVEAETDNGFRVDCVTDGIGSVDDLRGLLSESAPKLASRVKARIVGDLSSSAQRSNDVPAIRGGGVAPGLAELPQTLPEALQRAAQNKRAGAIVHLEADGAEHQQTPAQLLAEAAAVCGGLRRQGLRAGDNAVLLLERSAEVLPAFWGCLLAGVRPVIAQVPPTFRGDNRGLDQLCHVWRLLEQPLLICSAGLIESVRSLAERLEVQTVRCADIASLLSAPPATEFWSGRADETAFFSLSSGSTGVPKCIMLTHANLIQRAHGANLLCQHSAEDVILNWLPFDHIGSISDWHLRCVLLGCRMVYAGKESVIARPLRWLELIDRHRVTHTWAPNFAYSLVCHQLAAQRAEHQPPPKWDLSCVDGMLTAGESVSPKVVHDLLGELAPFGLPTTAIRPAFGMAELGSGITYQIARADEPVKVHAVRRDSLQGRVVPTSPDAENASVFTNLGPPIPGVSIRIVNDSQQVVPENTVGHLQIKGAVVSPGYFRNPEANGAFHDDGWFETGDLGFLTDGELVITGREQQSIIIRGVNYACSEIEEAVSSVAGVEPSFTAACALRRPDADREELAVFFHTAAADDQALATVLREVQRSIVRQMGVRADFLLPVPKEAIPKTVIGKLQRGELSRRFVEGEFRAVLEHVAELHRHHDWNVAAGGAAQLPQSEIEKKVAAIWQEVLGVEQIGADDNLFDLGGDSLLLAMMHSKLQQEFGPAITLVELFNYPTIRTLANFLGAAGGGASREAGQKRRQRRAAKPENPTATSDVAVIGMACRFPGASNLQQFWQNLCDGVESMQFFSDEEVLAAGIDPKLLRDPNYVKVAPVLPDIEWFDARFFGITAREAVLMDPQQRLLLECAWETFENAGYNPQTHPGSVGVYAGAVMNTYLINHLFPARAFQSPDDASEVLTLDSLDGFRVMVCNDKDYLPTRISYKLNLRGPSVNVQTACSTTLVAIHMAAHAVQTGECDMALAGGVSIKVPQETGYLYLDDVIVSPDGHCRAFDARAQGTVFGNGAGMVLLKRLDEAIADGDHIFAVIKGSAVNNDGSAKVGYMAPSQEGLATVVSEALDRSGVDPRTIGFVEAHGTGTALGDPIEVGALSQAFREFTPERGFCAVGSVKTNVGHLQIASGVAGFIKAVLALYHRQIPPTLHFEKPNPRIDFANSPFYVNDSLQDWPATDGPLRASVNSLGIGGTNAHVVLEEAPKQPQRNAAPRGPYLLPISARTPASLRALIGRYLEALDEFDEAALPDLCLTAAIGRVQFSERFAAIGSTIASLRSALTAALHEGNGTARLGRKADRSRAAFLFSGLGGQRVGMCHRLYETQPRFRETLERCSSLLANELPQPLLDLLFSPDADASVLEQPAVAAPVLFAVEFALAELWRDWGIVPSAVLGQGLGEYVAACVAGVFNLEGGLRLASAAGRALTELKLQSDASARESVLAAFRKVVDEVGLSPPQRLLVSSLTGAAAGKEITTADYWCRQLVETGRLADGMRTLAETCDRFVEIGPQPTLLPLARDVLGEESRFQSDACWLPSLRNGVDDWTQIQETLSALYVAGLDVDWQSFHRDSPRRRVPLPSYPFDRKRFWVDRPTALSSAERSNALEEHAQRPAEPPLHAG
jgi:acyl transferase domain-containing protein/acyl-CoA synthetase (AMP-forming)/AMP-acid ligase II/acyl carrier protein